ncbi:DoxX family protein [Nonomuraea jiangxiensis]|uniref:DoxX-like family protein n=1 Tax=Nonomuraea jiangxiensis TaxID=633440 RepID=A0A1G8QCU6_9ACTN|nr:DoxX family protein [Nonomuraea jiangxiensis]SDJ02396.1 DoxX-like family protein [Nonomuraea jiangxiensis]
MNVTAVILSIVLAGASLAGGAAKLAGARSMREDARRFGLSYSAYRLIGLSEALAAAGLLAGLARWPIGIAAAAGLVCLMAGAVAVHLRAGDAPAKTAAPIAVACLAIITALIQTAAA